MSFASTFFNPNSVIQTERKSILYCKLQVIVTLLEATNQNARAVSLPPGYLSYLSHICIYSTVPDCILVSQTIFTGFHVFCSFVETTHQIEPMKSPDKSLVSNHFHNLHISSMILHSIPVYSSITIVMVSLGFPWLSPSFSPLSKWVCFVHRTPAAFSHTPPRELSQVVGAEKNIGVTGCLEIGLK